MPATHGTTATICVIPVEDGAAAAAGGVGERVAAADGAAPERMWGEALLGLLRLVAAVSDIGQQSILNNRAQDRLQILVVILTNLHDIMLIPPTEERSATVQSGVIQHVY